MLLLVFLSARSKPVESVIDVLMNQVDLKEDFYNNNPKAERYVESGTNVTTFTPCILFISLSYYKFVLFYGL